MCDQQSDHNNSQDRVLEAEDSTEDVEKEKIHSIEEETSSNEALLVGKEEKSAEILLEPNTIPPNTQPVPFTELLKTHSQQMILGFEFGEESRLSAQKQIKAARNRNSQEEKEESYCNELEHQTSSQESDDESDQDNNATKPSSSTIIMTEINHKTPHSCKRQKLYGNKRKLKSHNDMDLPVQTRKTPLPLLEWADSVEVWNFMIYKEEAALSSRNSRLFEDFSNFTPRMRAILLDWLMEVCEVYHLRRVTYYLSVDYFDRFVSIRPDIPRNQLQLVGITCLFISSKVEEIYPPNVTEFSYVCDGACTIEDILACELLILNSLGWEVILTTPTDWLNLYMQLHFKAPEIMMQRLHVDINKNFVFPQYSGYQFTRASQLMDLFSLDPGFLKFRYSVVAASAMYFMYGRNVALAVSGLTWEQLRPCADYMSVFFKILKNAPDPRLKSYLGGDSSNDNEANNVTISLRNRVDNIVKDENYSIQTHVASMEYFEQATIIRLSEMTGKFEQIIDEKSKLADVTNINNKKTNNELGTSEETTVISSSSSSSSNICDKIECTEQLLIKENCDNNESNLSSTSNTENSINLEQ